MKEYGLDEATYVRNYVALEKRNQLSTSKRILLAIVSGGLIGGMVVIGQYLAVAILAGLMTIFVWYWIKGPEWTARRNYRISSVLRNPIRIGVNEEGIHYATVQGEGILNRGGFFRIEETEEIFFVQHNNGVHLYIPIDHLTPQEIELIREFGSVEVDPK